MSTLNVDQIGHSTSGTTALTVDSSGRILTPARPAFLLRVGSTQSKTSMATGWHKFDFTTTSFDVGNNVASSVFTAPLSGLYQFNLSTRMDALGGSFFIIVLAHTTSTPSGSGEDSDLYWSSYAIDGNLNSTFISLNTSCSVELTSGQTVVPWYYTNDTTFNIRQNTHFSGHLVG